MDIYGVLLLNADDSANLTAWSTIALAALAFAAIIVQIAWNRRILREARESSLSQSDILFQQLQAQNENAFKYSSVTLADSFQREFDGLTGDRAAAAHIILHNGLLTKDGFDYNVLEELLEDAYDFFDTVGFFVRKHYMKGEVAHQYFDHWFSHYFAFYKLYELKPDRYGAGLEQPGGAFPTDGYHRDGTDGCKAS